MSLRKFFLASLLSLTFCFSGCFSGKQQPLTVSSVYPFEGRYDATNEIVIDNEKCSFNDNDSVWVLSNHTLYYLLTSVSDFPNKIVFGKKEYTFKKSSFPTNENESVKSRDAFDDEEFVWITWTIPTNGIR